MYAKTAIRIVHTHAHTRARRRAGCRHTQVGRRLLFTQPWHGSVLEAASLKKV